MARRSGADAPAFSDKPHDNTFFYEATRRLCSSMRPETSVALFYEYIADFLPLYSFTLSTSLFPYTEAIVVAAVVGVEVCRPFEKIPFTQEQTNLAEKLDIHNPEKFHNYLMTNPQDDFFRYLALLNHKGLSLPAFFLRLVREGSVIGTAVFSGKTVFNERHLRLMRGLEGPLCIALSNMLQHRELEQSRADILNDNRRLRQELKGLTSVDVIGAHHGLAKVIQKVRQAAPVDVPILITGETGTGKEIIAKAVHELSSRRGKPFVAVNCGALPPSLIDSELFGHVRGAFTGATESHAGYFERAEGGTLFLDEIGELPLEAQSRLLRVLETGEVDKVGGSAPLPVHIRLVAATNRHLADMVWQGSFRPDLFFRLNVVNISLPPLRERREDIPRLVQYLLQRSAARFGVLPPRIDAAEMERLLAYDWPGNVRELQNKLEEALVCCENGLLRCRFRHDEDGPVGRLITPSTGTPDQDDTLARPPAYDEQSREYFLALLRRTNGRIAGPKGAALLARMHPNTFRFRCRKLGIDWHGAL